jgi:hypothetical protein
VLGQPQNVVLETVPSSLGGIRVLIAYARREGYLDDPAADQEVGIIERGIAGMMSSGRCRRFDLFSDPAPTVRR